MPREGREPARLLAGMSSMTAVAMTVLSGILLVFTPSTASPQTWASAWQESVQEFVAGYVPNFYKIDDEGASVSQASADPTNAESTFEEPDGAHDVFMVACWAMLVILGDGGERPHHLVHWLVQRGRACRAAAA